MELIQWLNEQRAIIHLALHVIVPWLVAYLFVEKHRIKPVFLLMVATMLVDIDHLLANPIYQPDRCSILFHPLHQVWAFVIYALMVLWPVLLWGLNKRLKPIEITIGWLGVGLVIHMLLDASDCLWMQGALLLRN